MTSKISYGYEAAIPWITYGGLGQSIIDAIAFEFANLGIYAVGKKYVGYTDLWQTGIFFVTDIVYRNVVEPYLLKQGMAVTPTQRNGAISLISFLVSAFLDWLMGKGVKNAIMHNMMSNSVGFGTNAVIDLVLEDRLV